MKRQLFTALILISIAFTSNANVLTVSNNPNAVAQYNNIPAAITAASAGDTIYVAGSPTNYGNITIDRRLVIIGAGFGNPNTPTGYATSINYIYLDSTNTASSSRTTFISLSVYSFDYVNGHNYPKNITIERCGFNYAYCRDNGWQIINCVVWSYLYVYNSAIAKIYNNIIYNYIQGNNSGVSNLVIDHNDFIGGYDGGLYDIDYAIITNNLFWQTGTLTGNSTFNSFSNNMSVIATGSTITFPNGTTDGQNNTGSGNFNSTDPKFVNVNSTYTGNYLAQDFHLQVGSPAIGKATDNTDLGIYGGLYPWASNVGSSNIPQITQLNIANPNVATNGTLKVTVKAIKQK
jgi:hypothetical protein